MTHCRHTRYRAAIQDKNNPRLSRGLEKYDQLIHLYIDNELNHIVPSSIILHFAFMCFPIYPLIFLGFGILVTFPLSSIKTASPPFFEHFSSHAAWPPVWLTQPESQMVPIISTLCDMSWPTSNAEPTIGVNSEAITLICFPPESGCLRKRQRRGSSANGGANGSCLSSA